MSMGMPKPKGVVCQECKIRFEDAKTDFCKVRTPGLFGGHYWVRQ